MLRRSLLALTVPLLGAALLAAAPAARPKPVDVAIKTSDGTFVVRLDPAHAPVTVANFLHYVDAGTYNGAKFYRTVRKATEPNSSIEVIQGGLNPQGINPMIAPIPLEPLSRTGLHNDDGALAMARTSDPNSATTEFFVDIGNDRFLDTTGGGYAVFGKVISGMDVVHKIHTARATGEMLSPPVTILSARRVR
jgi:peptidyl-prolyl cis-trans isomerase A (cyclophilin A)